MFSPYIYRWSTAIIRQQRQYLKPAKYIIYDKIHYIIVNAAALLGRKILVHRDCVQS